jgi:hypothetical protein
MNVDREVLTDAMACTNCKESVIFMLRELALSESQTRDLLEALVVRINDGAVGTGGPGAHAWLRTTHSPTAHLRRFRRQLCPTRCPRFRSVFQSLEHDFGSSLGLLERMQVRNQIFELLIGQRWAHRWHHPATAHDRLLDEPVVGRQPARQKFLAVKFLEAGALATR